MGTKKGGVEGESCFVLGGSPGKGVAVTDTVWNRCENPMVNGQLIRPWCCTFEWLLFSGCRRRTGEHNTG